MLCHECARSAVQTPAVGQCRYCMVALCKPHLIESFETQNVPSFACEHHPEAPFETHAPDRFKLSSDRPRPLRTGAVARELDRG